MDDYHYDLILEKGSLFASEDSARLIEAFSFEDESKNFFRETILEHEDISQCVTDLSHADLSKVGPFTGGLRLLVCADRNIEKKTRLPQPTNETTANTIPLSIPTFQTVLREFKIPKSFLKIYSRRTPALQTSILFDKGDTNLAQSYRKKSHEGVPSPDVIFSFVHQTDSNTRAFFSIGGSYCPNTGITSLLLCGLRDNYNEIDEFRRRLQHCLGRIPSPFLLSVILVELRLEYLERQFDEVHLRLHRQKITLGLDLTVSLPSHAVPDPMKTSLDIAEISKDVTEVISMCASKTYGCETQMKLAPKILEAAEYCQSIVPHERELLCRDAMTAVSSRLRQHEFWLANMHTRAQYLMHRAQGYASTIYNLLSQHDNSLSRQMAVISNSIASDSKSIAFAAARDSAVMKVIALVTTLFLPATFTATLFSTSFFDFQADEMSAIMSHRVWIYFVIAFCLTLLILGAGYPLYMLSLRRILSEDKARKMEAGERI